MTIYVPEATPAQGYRRLWALQALATPGAVSLAADINGVNTVDASHFFYADGWTPNLEQGKGQARRRLGTKRGQEKLNVPVETFGQLQYVCDPQEDDTDPDNELYALLVPGTTKVFLDRIGVDLDTAPATGQFVDVYQVRLGERAIISPVEDENADTYCTQGAVNTVPVLRKVPIVA